jgi:hypothetical protein
VRFCERSYPRCVRALKTEHTRQPRAGCDTVTGENPVAVHADINTVTADINTVTNGIGCADPTPPCRVLIAVAPLSAR